MAHRTRIALGALILAAAATIGTPSVASATSHDGTDGTNWDNRAHDGTDGTNWDN